MRKMSYTHRNPSALTPRIRPRYWYQVCRWTCPSSYQPPENSKDCDNQKCRFGSNCWYGHHGDEYTDAPGESNAFLRGSSIYYEKYPRAEMTGEHHFYRKGDPVKLFSGAWRKRSSFSSSPENERSVASLLQTSPKDRRAQSQKALATKHLVENANLASGKRGKGEDQKSTGKGPIGKTAHKLQPAVNALRELSNRDTSARDNRERGSFQAETKFNSDLQRKQSRSTTCGVPPEQLPSRANTLQFFKTRDTGPAIRPLLQANNSENAPRTRDQQDKQEAIYDDITFFHPNMDPYQALPGYVQQSFRHPDNVVIRWPGASSEGKQYHPSLSAAKCTVTLDQSVEPGIYECAPDYQNYVKDRAMQIEKNKPNVFFGYLLHVIENLETPPAMVLLVKEYLERLIIQAKHDRSNCRMKFQQLYYGLNDRELEEASMYRKMVEEILSSVSTLPVTGRDHFRKNAMTEWFERRYKDNQPKRKTPSSLNLASWYETPYLCKMGQFFSSPRFSQYLTSMHNYLLFLQIEFTKAWRRIGPLFHREWNSQQIGAIGRYGILTRALGSTGVDSEWEEFDYGFGPTTGLGSQRRPPSERAEWVTELHPDPLAQDPGQIFRLIAQVLHTDDWRTDSQKSMNALAFTFNEVPVFPSPPDFLFALLPENAVKELRSRQVLSEPFEEEQNVAPDMQRKEHMRTETASKRIKTTSLSKSADEAAPSAVGAKGEALPSLTKVSLLMIVTEDLKTHAALDISGNDGEVLPSGETEQRDSSAAPKGRNRAESLSKLRQCVETARRRKSSAASTRPQLQLDTDVASSTALSSSPDSMTYPGAPPFSAISEAEVRLPQLLVDGYQQMETSFPSTPPAPSAAMNETRTNGAIGAIGGPMSPKIFHRKTLSHITESVAEDQAHEKSQAWREDATAPKRPSYAEMAALDRALNKPTAAADSQSTGPAAGNSKEDHSPKKLKATRGGFEKKEAHDASKGTTESTVLPKSPVAPKKKKLTRKIQVPHNVKPKVVQNPIIDAVFSVHMAAMEDTFDYQDLPLLRYMEMVMYDRSIFITKYLMSVLRVWEETRRGEIYYNPTLENMQTSGKVKLGMKGTLGNERFSDLQRFELAIFFQKLEQYLDAFGLGVRFMEHGSNDEQRARKNEGGYATWPPSQQHSYKREPARQ
ncbi:hypothetical protein BJ508DRAFT_304572 [Ascobolus immersus RN42]|uniref:Uncharacterized protein n=1 Tax=Ascobolus immersus RN42 TaxID=1160509 RepID=A0A3N4IHN9_ASCIM|nr:hypothetical protein BJ508DRAFT_304572 [Ascobolus immersus RN42]